MPPPHCDPVGDPVRPFILILLITLVAVMPIWRFNHHWTYGPAIMVAFLLAVNLLVMLLEAVSRWRERR
jgi:hypothetical protein